MARIAVSVVVVLWLELSALGADETRRGERRPAFRPGVRTPAEAASATQSAGGAPAQRPAAAGPLVRPQFVATPEPVPVVPAKDGQREHKRVVVRLKAVPATDLAGTVNQLLRTEGRAAPSASARSVVIVPDPISNSLVIGGPPDAVDEVRQLVEQLDHPAAMVRLEVVFGEAPVSEAKAGPGGAKPDAKKAASSPAGQLHPIEKPGQIEILTRAVLTTLDNQPAFLQVGRREARITGAAHTSTGRVNQITYENVGTIVGFTPRVGPDRQVTLEIDVEDSRLGPSEEGTPLSVSSQGETVRAPNIDTFNAQTTLRIPDGETLVLGGMARQTKSAKQRVILVTPQVLPMRGEAKAR